MNASEVSHFARAYDIDKRYENGNSLLGMVQLFGYIKRSLEQRIKVRIDATKLNQNGHYEYTETLYKFINECDTKQIEIIFESRSNDDSIDRLNFVIDKRRLSKQFSMVLKDKERTVKTLDNTFMNGCEKLTSIELPDSITEIYSDFMYFCPSLISIVLPNNLTRIGDRFMNEYHKLTSIDLPNSVSQVGDNFMCNCYSLISIVLPNSLTQVGDNFMNDCPKLTSIVLHNSLTQVGDNFICNCRSLTSIVLPNNLKQIGNDFIKGCRALPSNISEEIENIRHRCN